MASKTISMNPAQTTSSQSPYSSCSPSSTNFKKTMNAPTSSMKSHSFTHSLLDPTSPNNKNHNTTLPKTSTNNPTPNHSSNTAVANTEPSNIENIWAFNLHEAMAKICEIVEKYPYIALDTEFPGVVARPVDSFRHWLGYGYRLVEQNVNVLKLIQLGLTFYNQDGETPSPISTWQFNFKFNIKSDMFAPDSIQLLMRSGIDFQELQQNGIDHHEFAEEVMMSGLVLSEDVRWICFHGAYDFAYLVKTLRNCNLPKDEKEFFWWLEKYFPLIYDLKVLLRNVRSLKGGGLQKLANTLNVERVGSTHQAGSDSLLTGDVFFKMRELYFEELMDEKKYLNTLYGLGSSAFAKSHNSCSKDSINNEVKFNWIVPYNDGSRSLN